MKKLIISLWLVAAAALGGQYYVYFASDYGTPSQDTLTNVLGRLGTNNWTYLVIDGGDWTITNGQVVVPENVELIVKRGSEIIENGGTLTVHTIYKDVRHFKELFVDDSLTVSGSLKAATIEGDGAAISNVPVSSTMSNVFVIRNEPEITADLKANTHALNQVSWVGLSSNKAIDFVNWRVTYAGTLSGLSADEIDGHNSDYFYPASNPSNFLSNQSLAGSHHSFDYMYEGYSGEFILQLNSPHDNVIWEINDDRWSVHNDNVIIGNRKTFAIISDDSTIGNQSRRDNKYLWIIAAHQCQISEDADRSAIFNSENCQIGEWVAESLIINSFNSAITNRDPPLDYIHRGLIFNSDSTVISDDSDCLAAILTTNCRIQTSIKTMMLNAFNSYAEDCDDALILGEHSDVRNSKHVFVWNASINGDTNSFNVGTSNTTVRFDGQTIWNGGPTNGIWWLVGSEAPTSSTAAAQEYTIVPDGTNVYLCYTNNWLGSGTNWIVIHGELF